MRKGGVTYFPLIWGIVILVYLLIGLAIILFSDGAHAGGPTNWWQSLRQPGTGLSCCNIADCAYTQARFRQGHWQAKVGDLWRDIPDDKVLKDEVTPDGHAVVCNGSLSFSPSPVIYCFIPEAGGT